MNDKKFSRNDGLILSVIVIFTVLMIVSLTKGKYLYGSDLDWKAQHSVLPDYFRTLFYRTGELFPSLAPNLGGAENIYYISYYGLLSPIVLISYLFPSVEMAYYLIGASIISLIASVILFYFWVRRRFSTLISAFLTLFMTFSGPLILHSHRHIMFVIYMPLVVAGLFFIDLFFEKNIKSPLVFTVFLIVMTSYFFSVSAIFALTVYGIYRYIEISGAENRSFKYAFFDFVKKGSTFAFLIIVGVLLSCVLIVPTALALLNGRNPTNSGIDLTKLLPTVKLNIITFGSYSLGASSFIVLSLTDNLISGKKQDRCLAMVFMLFVTCPVFIWLLNGFEYLDGKVLVPFIPVSLILCGKTLCRIKEGSFEVIKVLLLFTAVSVAGILLCDTSLWRISYLIDFLIVAATCLIVDFLHKNSRRQAEILLSSSVFLVIPLISCVLINTDDKLVSVDEYNEIHSKNISSVVDKLCKNENTVVRTAVNIDAADTMNILYSDRYYNDTLYSSLRSNGYNKFYFDIMRNENSYRNRAIMSRSKNVFFNAYMGNKYWLTRDGGYVPEQYSKLYSEDGIDVYQANGAFPVGYATKNLMSRSEFNRLDYPANMEAMLFYTIVDGDLPDTGFQSNFNKVEVGDALADCKDFEKIDGKYIHRKGSGKFKYTWTLPDECKNKTLVLKFNVDNTICDVSNDVKIWVNGVANKLTAAGWKYYNGNSSFEYVITPRGEDKNQLVFTFKDEDYAVYDIELWTYDYSIVEEYAEGLDGFVFDTDRSVGDIVKGTIDVSEDGYFNLSYVYNDGYNVLVDGKKVEAECVDSCFLGFPITKGHHEIEIRFKAPGLETGKKLSALGALLSAAIIAFDLYPFIRKRFVK